MTLTVHLPVEIEGPLRRAAEEEGVAEDQFVIRTLEQRLLDDRRQGALEMLRQWREEDTTTDAAEIAERRRSWESFKASMNEHHSSGLGGYP